MAHHGGEPRGKARQIVAGKYKQRSNTMKDQYQAVITKACEFIDAVDSLRRDEPFSQKWELPLSEEEDEKVLISIERNYGSGRRGLAVHMIMKSQSEQFGVAFGDCTTVPE